MSTPSSPADPRNLFEQADLYDAMVDWEARRRREIPFYRRHLGAARRVLDVACGPGRQVTWLAEEGFLAEGCDLSPAMVEQARTLAAVSPSEPRPEFFEADMTALPRDRGPYDGITCVGNSIATLPAPESLDALAAGVAALLAPGGVFICQSVNFQRLAGTGPQYLPVTSGTLSGREALFLKVMEFPARGGAESRPSKARIDIVVMQRGDEGWVSQAREARVSAWSRADLEGALGRAGLVVEHVLGDQQDAPFDSATSRDLIVIARRPQAG